MRRLNLVILLICFGVLLIPGCDKGIQAPPETAPGGAEQQGFSGVIRYSNWPPTDSLVDLRLIAFKTFPPRNILADALTGQAIVYPPIGPSPSLPFNVDTTHYFVPTPPGEFQYIVVAQQFGPNVFSDWRAVGQYDLDANLAVPTPIRVPENGRVRNVDIVVDFSRRPPQPF
jgi:hypothetical protein